MEQKIGNVNNSFISGTNVIVEQPINPNKRKNKADNIKWFMGITIVVNLILTSISLMVLVQIAPRNLEFDYIGAIVGILGVLVTILIGLQIYNALNIKTEMRETQEKSNLLLMTAQLQNQKALLSFYATMFEEKTKTTDMYGCFTFGLLALLYSAPIKESIGFCETTIKAMIEMLPSANFTLQQRVELRGIANEINKTSLNAVFKPLYERLILKKHVG